MSLYEKINRIKIREIVIVGIIMCILACVSTIFLKDISEGSLLNLFYLLMGIYLFVRILNAHGKLNDIKDIKTSICKKDYWILFIGNLTFAFLCSIILFYFNLISFDETTNLIGFEYWLNVVTIVVLGPFVEEIICRGVLFNRLSRRIYVIPALIISSLIFGVGHGSGFVSAFIFGVCMCLIYMKTHNILISMSIHFLNNLACLLIDYFDPSGMMVIGPYLYITIIISVVFSILLFNYLIKTFPYIKKFKLKKEF